MRTTEEQVDILKHLLLIAQKENEGETEWIEFKTNIGESHCSVTYERVGHYISGLANAACIKDKAVAYLVLGIEDSSWNIVGTNLHMLSAKFGNQDYELWLRRNLSPMITFEIEEFTLNEKHIVMFIIPAATGEPVAFKNVEYIRVGSNLTKLSDFRDYKQKIYNSEQDWSAQVIPNATIDDLDPKAISKAKELFASKNENIRDEIQHWSDEVFLNKAKLTRRSKITNTAIVLLGKEESEVLISPSVAKIRWILKDSNGIERDYMIKSCPLLLSIEDIYNKLRNLKYRYINTSFQSLFPEEIDTYDPYLIREAINNAIAHQDYRLNGMINVIEFEDKLVFTNKGGFIPENIQFVLNNDAPEEIYRNRFLAQAMVDLKMVDTIGSGIRRMFNSQRKRLFPMPDYNLQNNRVQVTIIGRILDLNYSLLLSQRQDLTLSDIEMLNKVQIGKPLTNHEIDYLRKRKLIEGRKPNIYLAKSVAQTTGKKIEYIKNKGLNDTYYKHLIIEALKLHTTLSRKEFEELLLDKLPDILSFEQRRSKIGNLLSALRMAKVIQVEKGKTWRLSKL